MSMIPAHPALPSSWSALVLATAAAAQGSLVSPAINATVEGTSNSTVPFAIDGARRVLQIHGDLGTTARSFIKLAFRVNASTNNYTGTRAIDLALHVGPTVAPSAIRFFYDQNYVGPRTQVIARRVVNFGPQGQAISPGPNPFTANMDLPFDAPYAFPGTTALGWEAQMYGNVSTGTFSALDGEFSSARAGTSNTTGSGCVCTGRASAMLHTANAHDSGGILAVNFTITNGPGSAPVVLSLGVTNPNLPFPGLCSDLLTDLTVQVPIGSTTATGSIPFTQAGASTLVLPNAYGGAVLYTQAHAFDPGRAGIPLCNSNGQRVTLPTSDLTRVTNVSRIYNFANTATATEAGFVNGFTVGFGIVTEFSYQ